MENEILVTMKEIFIVEDNLHIQEMLEFLLNDQDYKVTSFSTAESFRNGIHGATPDLILMDLRLPDGNGIELCRGLKENEETKGVPVFLMSAHAQFNITSDICAEEFIPKPFDIDDLIEKVNLKLA